MNNVSKHRHSCDCDDCKETFEEKMAESKNTTRKNLCQLCQGTGNYYRQLNEFGYGVCPKCCGSGLTNLKN